MSAIVASGQTRQLDRQAEPDEQVTPEYVADQERMARLLMRILRDLALMKRRFWPRRADHEDRVVDGTGTTKYRFPHGYNGRIRWFPVDWSGATAGPRLVRHADTDNNTLVLVSYTAGTVTLRVEEAG